MRAAILEGRKSVTRRIWKRPHVKEDGIYKVRKGRYSKEFYFKIQVLYIYKERLKDMVNSDAIAEVYVIGFEKVED
jgi:hypothetical protein